MISLPEFIERVGDVEAGHLFGVSTRTAQSWRLRERYPRPKQAAVIIDATAGEINYVGIYAPEPAAQQAPA